MKPLTRILSLCCAATVLWCAELSAQQSAADALQSALYKQQVEGDLEGAISLYAMIAVDHAGDRAIAARALLQMGLAYETFGSEEAVAAYRDLLARYPDQTSATERARDRLAILRPEPSERAGQDVAGLVARRLWSTRGNFFTPGAVSPDGREVVYVQWQRTLEPGNSGFLVAEDVATGEQRVVGRSGGGRALGPDGTYREGEDTYVKSAIWSRDGARVAYSEWANTWDHDVIHVVDADGANDRVVSDNTQNAEVSVKAWSSDGERIFALIRGWDDEIRIASIAVEDGTVTTLKTVGPGLSLTAASLSLSPDDRWLAYSYPPSPGSPPDVFVLAVDGRVETSVAASPATDRNPLWTPEGDRLLFLSDRSGSADFWGVPMSEGRQAGEPVVVSAHAGPVLPLDLTERAGLSYSTDVSETDLRVVSLAYDGGTTDQGPLTDRHVGSNSRPTWSPTGRHVAYLSVRPETGLTPRLYLVVKSMVDGTERDIELDFPLYGETRPSWTDDGRHVLLLASLGAPAADGTPAGRASYRIDIESGVIVREEHFLDYAGFWGTERARHISERQSLRLRELGIRLLGQRDLPSFVRRDAMLRPGERALWVRNGIGWVHAFECAATRAYPQFECLEGHDLIYDEVVPAPRSGYLRGWELSPDGGRLAYLIENREDPVNARDLWIWNLAEPTPALAGTVEVSSGRNALRWTPDGRDVLFLVGATDNQTAVPVQRFRVDSGELEILPTAMTADELAELSFDPNGRRAILATGPRTPRKEIWTLSGFPWEEGGR
jgi:Tol biopolymer transport system component